MWNKDERDGKIDRAKGRVKEAVGDLTGNRDLAAEGRADQTAGEVHEAVGHMRRKVGDAIETIKKAVKRP